METKSAWWFFLLIMCFIDYIKTDYKFKTEKIRSIELSFRVNYDGTYSKHPFSSLKSKKRNELCQNARTAEPILQGMDDTDTVLEAEVWLIRYFESKDEPRDKIVIYDIAISCPTKPPSYLHIENLKKPELVNIVLLQNISDRYEFQIERVEYVVRVEVPDPNEDVDEDVILDTDLEELQESDLSFWNHEDRINLCITARSHVENAILSLNKPIGRADIYEFTISNKRIEKHYAVECPSEPVMYLRLSKKGNLIKVVLPSRESMDTSDRENDNALGEEKGVSSSSRKAVSKRATSRTKKAKKSIGSGKQKVLPENEED